jgi:phosphocarrier protein
MYTMQTIVKCESGLHNKQATYFIQKANEFRSSIWIEVDDRRINAKSLLGVLSMGVTTGTTVTLVADGVDEEAAVNALSEMLVEDIF